MMTGHRIWLSITGKRNCFPLPPPLPPFSFSSCSSCSCSCYVFRLLLLRPLLLPRFRLFLIRLISFLLLLHFTFFFPSQMVKIMEEYLDDYNQINTAQMKLVLFGDAVRHVARISRVIRQPLGNALLLGVGGSGRQSLTRLAAHM